MVHIGFQLEHFADQLVADRGDTELEGGIAAEHEAHLERKIPLFAAVEQFFILREILAGGLVHVHGQIALHAAQRDRDEVVVRNLHRDGLDSRIVQHLFLAHPAKSLIRGEVDITPSGRPAGGAVVHHADDFKDLRQSAQGVDLA